MNVKALIAVFYTLSLVAVDASADSCKEAAKSHLKDIPPSALQSSVLDFGKAERAEFARFEPSVPGHARIEIRSGKGFPASSAQSEVLKKR
ncbi:MAG: hypothetical protein PHT19_12035 [Methylococcus sp.]|nr:hypothetical protein [Methylococcus sp.]